MHRECLGIELGSTVVDILSPEVGTADGKSLTAGTVASEVEEGLSLISSVVTIGTGLVYSSYSHSSYMVYPTLVATV